jgi:hypothetical protein
VSIVDCQGQTDSHVDIDIFSSTLVWVLQTSGSPFTPRSILPAPFFESWFRAKRFAISIYSIAVVDDTYLQTKICRAIVLNSIEAIHEAWW